MLSKNTEEKFVLLGAHSLKAEVERSTLFLFMQFYGEETKKKVKHLCFSEADYG